MRKIEKKNKRYREDEREITKIKRSCNALLLYVQMNELK